MVELISKDSFATLLLCSYVTPLEKIVNNYKPFTQKEWINLSTKIVKTEIARPSNLFKKSVNDIIEQLRITNEEADRIITLLARGPSMAIEVEKLSSMGIWIITRADKLYPKRFKKVLKSLSPTIIYGAGDINILETESIGIVGSRNANQNAIEFTKKLSKKAVSESFTVVSGGSKGIDSFAHQTAIENGGKTIAILSDGLSKFIKKKENLNNILNKQLVAISPYHPNARFYSYTALERNKFIYGLSEFTVATSSDFKKGGTWSGAVENLKMNWVPLYVREDKDSKGLSELENMGAKKLTINDFKETMLRSLLALEPTFKEEEIQNCTDIYTLAWPLIDKYLNKPIRIEKLCEILDIELIQLNVWLKKANSEGKVNYLDIETVVSSVFYNPDMDKAKQLNIFEQ
ncbi:DNA-processing protein DprA [Peribacillus frigoritolerans]|uniref:DNA-processing protein DprA n=1 Tax=Peribacillus frigoritolerans TaxID=450367 RepID=UPI00201BDD90|nr:DNA-processing protein DprA [Peribacillus frigoritolerans]